VKRFWSGTKPAFGGAPIPTTVLEIGIDTRAKNATFHGDFDWLGVLKGKYIAAFKKDKGVWKIRALDLGKNTGRIKQIKPPQEVSKLTKASREHTCSLRLNGALFISSGCGVTSYPSFISFAV